MAKKGLQHMLSKKIQIDPQMNKKILELKKYFDQVNEVLKKEEKK